MKFSAFAFWTAVTMASAVIVRTLKDGYADPSAWAFLCLSVYLLYWALRARRDGN